MSLEQAGVKSFSELAEYGAQWARTPGNVQPESPSWLSKLWEPIANFGLALGKPLVQTYEKAAKKLPDILWGYAGKELGLYEQSEGAGVTTIYSQEPYAGGTPASTPYVVVTPSGTAPVGIPYATQQAGVATSSNLIYVIIIAIVAMIIFRGK